MKRRNSLLLLVAVALLACAPQESGYPLLGGGKVQLSELHGKVVLINYWAIWCKPCRLEIPELNAFQREFPDQVALFAVNFDGVSGAELDQQVADMGIEFQSMLADPRENIGAVASGVLPETIVIDSRGQFHQILLGPQTAETLNNLLSSLTEGMDYPE